MGDTLKCFDAYPFPVIALSENRQIVYRNYVAQKLYPQIHLKASIKMYSGIDFCQGFTNESFFNTQTTMFSYVTENKQILIIFPIHTFRHLFSDDNEYKKLVEAVTGSDKVEELCQKSRANLRYLTKLYKKAMSVNLFLDLFVGDKAPLLNEKLYLPSILKAVVNTFKLKTDFDLQYKDCEENIICLGDKKFILISIISCINFVFLNAASQSAKTEILFKDDCATIRFVFDFNDNKEKLQYFSRGIFQKDMPTNALILGLSKSKDLKVDIKEKDNVCTLELVVRATKTSEFIFCDDSVCAEDIEKIINFYISLN